ncbi:hypothetical protein M413DRAFT_217950 [Hebeloma cylindrosporum]|uniref:Uncharacterized protein n=1 Tax=Hebeloma cylindrosporum TaxID=76867 RepID=A0A0C3CGX7_HEBCY|nr:hypothetical protein M413DRAFT_217950 [Hebeloma cylindrosporum h7]
MAACRRARLFFFQRGLNLWTTSSESCAPMLGRLVVACASRLPSGFVDVQMDPCYLEPSSFVVARGSSSRRCRPAFQHVFENIETERTGTRNWARGFSSCISTKKNERYPSLQGKDGQEMLIDGPGMGQHHAAGFGPCRISDGQYLPKSSLKLLT